MNYFILRITGNQEGSLVISTQEITEDIAALFLLIYTDAHTRAQHDGIHDSKENYDDDATIYDNNN